VEPKIQSGSYSIYFFEDIDTVLFKINKENIYKFKDIREESWKVINKIKLHSKKEFNSITKDIFPKVSKNEEDSWYQNETAYFSSDKISDGAILRTNYIFLMLRLKSFRAIRKRILKEFKARGKIN